MTAKRGISISIIIILAAVIIVMGGIIVKGQDEHAAEQKTARYYTSCQIQSGDTVWSIAEQYYSRTDDDLRTYVGNILTLNNIADERMLQPGAWLTVYYDMPD